MQTTSHNKPPISLDVEAFRRVFRDHGMVAAVDIARELGVGEGTISRLLSGESRPGIHVVDKCVQRFGPHIYDVFFRRQS